MVYKCVFIRYWLRYWYKNKYRHYWKTGIIMNTYIINWTSATQQPLGCPSTLWACRQRPA